MSSGAMIGWLRGDQADPAVTVGDRTIPVAITRHARARRMTLRLAPDGSEVRLTIPRWGHTREALEFVGSRREWLARQLEALPQAIPVAPGAMLQYRGEAIRIDWRADLPRAPEQIGSSIRIGGPDAQIPGRLQRWLESRALELMTHDLTHYCALADVSVPKLALSRARRRWGSCSTSGTVRINWRLVQAPDHVRRSVVAHEVAHLVHFDHSREFHALLGRIFGDRLNDADRWLKTQGRSLYAAFP